MRSRSRRTLSGGAAAADHALGRRGLVVPRRPHNGEDLAVALLGPGPRLHAPGVGESERIAVVSRGAGDAFSETASIARCGGGAGTVAVLDFDENGVPDLLVDASLLVENRSLDPVRVRRGAVNAGAGRIADVLLCNGSPGLGAEREIRVAPSTPFEIAMLGTPFDADGPVRYALFAWLGHGPTSAPAAPRRAGLRLEPGAERGRLEGGRDRARDHLHAAGHRSRPARSKQPRVGHERRRRHLRVATDRSSLGTLSASAHVQPRPIRPPTRLPRTSRRARRRARASRRR